MRALVPIRDDCFAGVLSRSIRAYLSPSHLRCSREKRYCALSSLLPVRRRPSSARDTADTSSRLQSGRRLTVLSHTAYLCHHIRHYQRCLECDEFPPDISFALRRLPVCHQPQPQFPAVRTGRSPQQ
ncbi:hypothetical protein BDN71DRAFT_776587 [Pleurotus eryngii]|uniref:Uncharacterized protein n=1 Tax=Pleurotus eryngii TaxID=5323 RepID=A0A9P6D8Q4_PLEER|nr:hypothetical protein BDN71DRAFT_776587 [Pleurotus eryngii]